MQKRIELLESIKYINKMRELVSLGDTINIKARLIHLERIILEDFASLPKEQSVTDEDIDKWIADQDYSEHKAVAKYALGLRDGAKAHRDGLIKK